MDDYTIGEWWSPSKPNHKIKGILIYNIEESFARLELFGHLETSPESFITINGHDDKGRKLALYQCTIKSVTGVIGDPTGPRDIYNVNRVFEKLHANSDGRIYLDNISVRFTETNKWSGLSAFEIDQNGLSNDFGVQTKESEIIEANLDNKCNLIINLYVSIPFIFDKSIEEVKLKQQCYFTFNFTNPIDFETIELEYIRHLQNFLIIAISEPIHIKKLISSEKVDKDSYKEITIRQEYESDKSNGRRLHNVDMHFTLPDYKEKIAEMISTWFKKKIKLKHVLNSYISRRLNKPYFEDYFLGLARSIELYHRFFIGGGKIEEEVKERLINLVEKNIEESYLDNILPTLQYIEEPSFKERINSTYDKFEKIVEPFIKRNAFSHKVSLLRNYWTHYDSKYEEEIKSYNDFVLANQLSVLLDVCLISEMGFSDQELKDIIEDRRDYNILTKNKLAT